MELSDYEDPNDRYTPRPKASQAVAAAKRQRPTHDTEPIEPIAPVATSLPVRQYVPFGIGALVLIVLMIGMASYQLAKGPARPLQITPAPTEAANAAAVPTATPAATSAPEASTATIGAYAAPDGLLLGQIELDRMITPVAHFGRGWLQADVVGSGLVWLRASDVPDLALTGPDLAPRAAVAPQSGRGLTLDQRGDAADTTESAGALDNQQYLANVGAQAAHSPRGGQCGPTSGDCAPGVPVGIDNNQYIANVGVQAPHKIR